MVAAVADTHALIWYLYGDSRLSPTALNFIEGAGQQGDQIAISSITLIEMVYLIERGRIAVESLSLVANELAILDGLFRESPVDLQITRALTGVAPQQIPEMPDRIIAATAVHLKVPIISRDTKIQASDLKAIW